jgi:hypothetical protein
MPCLRLTTEQAMRLFSLDRPSCILVLNGLVDAGFLAQDCTGRYMRFGSRH